MSVNQASFRKARHQFHAELLKKVLGSDQSGVPSNADKDSVASVKYAMGILERIRPMTGVSEERRSGQEAGKVFETLACDFLNVTFLRLKHLRPGRWLIQRASGKGNPLAEYEQYSHLKDLDAAIRDKPQLAAAIGNDYVIAPDIVILREPEPDEVINLPEFLVDSTVARRSSIRASSGGKHLLHASISCKWTIRSDRAQNSRSEALNLMRNRKGRAPHIVVVTAEPLPSRLASIALGTGDIDCVYHFALHELQEAIDESGSEDAKQLMSIMSEGKRLKDISDLPLDLAV